ncbi:hypothetical protein CP061683_1338A, partial [Chlamydia psittaci 06-1683]
MTLPVRKFFT